MPRICWWNWNRAAPTRLDAAGCSVCGFAGADGNRPTRQFHAVGLGGFRRGQPVLDGKFSAELVKPVAALQPAHDLASQARRRPRPSLAAPACSRQHTNSACEFLGKSHFTPCSAGHDFIHHPNRTECGRSSGVEHNLAKVRVESSNLFARSSLISDVKDLGHQMPRQRCLHGGHSHRCKRFASCRTKRTFLKFLTRQQIDRCIAYADHC